MLIMSIILTSAAYSQRNIHWINPIDARRIVSTINGMPSVSIIIHHRRRRRY